MSRIKQVTVSLNEIQRLYKLEHFINHRQLNEDVGGYCIHCKFPYKFLDDKCYHCGLVPRSKELSQMQRLEYLLERKKKIDEELKAIDSMLGFVLNDHPEHPPLHLEDDGSMKFSEITLSRTELLQFKRWLNIIFDDLEAEVDKEPSGESNLLESIRVNERIRSHKEIK